CAAGTRKCGLFEMVNQMSKRLGDEPRAGTRAAVLTLRSAPAGSVRASAWPREEPTCRCGRRRPIVDRLFFTMKIPTCACAPAASAVLASRSSALRRPAHRNAASNHLFGLVVGLAVTAQRGGLCAGVKLFQSRRDLGVLP